MFKKKPKKPKTKKKTKTKQNKKPPKDKDKQTNNSFFKPKITLQTSSCDKEKVNKNKTSHICFDY